MALSLELSAAAKRQAARKNMPTSTSGGRGAAETLAVVRPAIEPSGIRLGGLAFRHLLALDFLHGAARWDRDRQVPGAQWVEHLDHVNTLDGGGWAILCEGSDVVAGIVIYGPADRKGRGAILSVALALDLRGRGMGTKAVQLACEQLLGPIGFESVFADVELINVACQRMLRKVGFEALTPGNTPGVQVASERPAQRWRLGQPNLAHRCGLINLGAVGAL